MPSTPVLVGAARSVAQPAGGVRAPQQPYPQPFYPQGPYPQAPYPQRPASPSGIAITALILCTAASLSLVWSATSVIAGNPPVLGDMPSGAALLGNAVWTIGDILVIIGTILMWSRASAGRVLAIIGLSMVLAAMVGFELVALSATYAGFVSPWAYLINVLTILSLAFVLLPDTGRYLRAGRAS